MAWRQRMAAWLTRSASSGAAAPAPANGIGGNGNGSAGPTATLPPWGNQWPYGGLWAGRNYAENLPVVSACISAIAGGIASLPMTVYGRDATGKRVERPDHRWPGCCAGRTNCRPAPIFSSG